jgi:hypothetical protein
VDQIRKVNRAHSYLVIWWMKWHLPDFSERMEDVRKRDPNYVQIYVILWHRIEKWKHQGEKGWDFLMLSELFVCTNEETGFEEKVESYRHFAPIAFRLKKWREIKILSDTKSGHVRSEVDRRDTHSLIDHCC